MLPDTYSVLAFIFSVILIPFVAYFVRIRDKRFEKIDDSLTKLNDSIITHERNDLGKFKDIEERIHELETNYKDRFEEVKEVINKNNLELRESNHNLRESIQTSLNEIRISITTLSAHHNRGRNDRTTD